MRLALSTRHRLLLVLTGDDARTAVEPADPDTVVDNTGGQFEPAPTLPVFGFSPDEDDE